MNGWTWKINKAFRNEDIINSPTDFFVLIDIRWSFRTNREFSIERSDIFRSTIITKNRNFIRHWSQYIRKRSSRKKKESYHANLIIASTYTCVRREDRSSNVYLTTSGGGGNGDVFWNLCVWCCLLGRKQRRAGIFEKRCPPHPASTIECDEEVNIFDFRMDSFGWTLEADECLRIVLLALDWRRLSLSLVISSSLNFSFVDGNNEISGWNGLLNSFP